jgi:AcrR family transcriptional regulator
MNDKPKRRRKRRTKEAIEETIDKAAITLIESGGFSNLTVRNIAEEAKIEAVVFYNRYANIEEFIDKFVKRYDYWFTEVVKTEGKISYKEEYLHIVTNLFVSLKKNKLMQQLLRWEIFVDNDITNRTARLREFHTIPLVEKYKKIFKGAPFEIEVMSALIIGGIYYLILHAERTPFAGLDVNSKAGHDEILKAIEFLGNYFFDTTSGVDGTALDIAKRMKEKGIENDIIEECTKVPTSILIKL